VSTTEIVVLIVVVLLLLALAAVLVARSRRRAHLQERFGPEYDRTLEQADGRRQAERDLAEREARRSSFEVRPLPAADRAAFRDRWQATQADFVDHPAQAVTRADALVTEVMVRRGYPMGDFDQRARDVSVDHAEVVQEYRAAHEISDLNDRHEATTEQLRQAMVHYRALFTELLDDEADDRDDPDDRDDRDGGEVRSVASAPVAPPLDERRHDEAPRARERVEVVRERVDTGRADSRHERPVDDVRPDRPVDDVRPVDRHADTGLDHDGGPVRDRDRGLDRDLDGDRDLDRAPGADARPHADGTDDVRVRPAGREAGRVEPGGLVRDPDGPPRT